MIAASLTTVVGAYKSAVTRAVRRTGAAFAWQERFHDHVIRSEKALHSIQTYIEAYPALWKEDSLFATTDTPTT